MRIAGDNSTNSDLEASVGDLIKRALAVGLQFESLIDRAARGPASFRLRLARAHALSAIDALTELAQLDDPASPISSHSGVYAMDEVEGRLTKKS